MTKPGIERLIGQIEAASSLDAKTLAQGCDLLRQVFPQAPASLETTPASAEAILHLVDVILPNWTIQLTGKAMEPDGHWRASLRESRGSDEDEMVGLGAAATVAQALIAALLRVALQKASS
jgi:hypothetical protein